SLPYAEDFDDLSALAIEPVSGAWSFASGGIVTDGNANDTTPATTIVSLGDPLPDRARVSATFNALAPVNGQGANAAIVFDYYSPNDYKIASVDLINNGINGQSSMAHMVNGVAINEKVAWAPSDTGVDHTLSVLIEDGVATLRIDGFKLITARY
ncbi:unnamed protein product, partial [Ectocarpus fasciculatus]